MSGIDFIFTRSSLPDGDIDKRADVRSNLSAAFNNVNDVVGK
ncbi:MAG: hypothetical protein ACLQO1_21430 [Steroidobacteraceae bacterium]